MAKSSKTKKLKKPAKVPYHYKPDHLTLDQWQKALREQFMENNYFGIRKLDDKKVFGDYQVYNSEKDTTYKVAIRSLDGSWNFFSCMDFKTNHL